MLHAGAEPPRALAAGATARRVTVLPGGRTFIIPVNGSGVAALAVTGHVHCAEQTHQVLIPRVSYTSRACRLLRNVEEANDVTVPVSERPQRQPLVAGTPDTRGWARGS